MIRLNASVSKKLPIEGADFSSRSFSAGVEIELASGEGTRIQEHLDKLHRILEEAVDRQFANAGSNGQDGHSDVTNRPAQQPSGAGQPGNGNGGPTDAQLRAIYGIAKSIGLDGNGGLASYVRPFGADRPEALTVKQASQVIDQLKGVQAANRNAAQARGGQQ